MALKKSKFIDKVKVDKMMCCEKIGSLEDLNFWFSFKHFNMMQTEHKKLV